MLTGKRWRALASLALMVGGLTGVAMAAPAGAATPDPNAPQILTVATTVTVIAQHPNTALVTGVYKCFGGQSIHLWVSVKQGGPDPTAEGSGETSRAWYDTNILGAPPVTCDGKWHAAVVTVVQHPDKGRLKAGKAWVQFCLVAPGGGEFGIVASQSQWDQVVGV